MNLAGQCEPQFSSVRAALKSSLESGADVGASVSVTHRDKTVVDLYGGYLDAARSEPWQQNTIINVYSTTKTMSFLCMLMLADRSELDFDANVATYWPEFAANGKADVKVWHLMNHAAGLSGLDEQVGIETYTDWEKMSQNHSLFLLQ